MESVEQRSATMHAVKSRDTKPEMRVRRLLHRMGYRYRLHKESLAGKPDIVFSSRRRVIFVHGCFWHGHGCKRGNRSLATNAEYWSKKISRNIERFSAQVEQLEAEGWRVLTLWECELQAGNSLAATLRSFLEKEPIVLKTDPLS